MTNLITLEESNSRLNELADFIENVRAERFDYSCFVRFPNSSLFSKPCPPSYMDQNCGTLGCALGWATAIPRFKELGAVLRYSTRLHNSVFAIKNDPEDDAFKAAQKIFGLSYTESVGLFSPNTEIKLNNGIILTAPGGGATSKQVANHIREFIRVRTTVNN